MKIQNAVLVFFLVFSALHLEAARTDMTTVTTNPTTSSSPPYAPLPSEAERRSEILAKILANPKVESEGVKVKVEGSTVTLTGIVNSQRERIISETVALMTDGIDKVKNFLRVENQQDLSDKDLEVALANKFKQNELLNHHPIFFEVNDGVAILGGKVDNSEVVAEAKRVALDLEGINSVNNEMEVTLSKDLDGIELARALENDFYWDAFLDPEKIDVDVEGDRVTLKGEVETRYQWKKAQNLAFQNGAKFVNNEIDVK